VALSFLNSGRSRFDFTAQARDLALMVCQEEKHPHRDPMKYLMKAWEGAERRADASPLAFGGVEQVTQRVEQVRAAANTDTWEGRSGNALRLTLEGALALCLDQMTLTPTLSVRVLSERTGLGKSTTARALTALTDRGYLSKALPAKQEKAATYHLNERTNWDTGSNPHGLESVSHLVPSLAELMGHDAFHAQALGHSALRVLAVLSELEGLTAEQIRGRLGFRSVVTARRALNALEAVGFAMRRRHGRGYVWTSRLDALDLAQIAADYGTQGNAERRKAEHERERRGFTEYLDAQDRRNVILHRSRGASLDQAVNRFHTKRAARRERLSA